MRCSISYGHSHGWCLWSVIVDCISVGAKLPFRERTAQASSYHYDFSFPLVKTPSCNKTRRKSSINIVGGVVSAIEKSDLHHVLIRKRPSSRLGPPFGVEFARRAPPCSSLPTAWGGLGRARVVSWRWFLFSFIVKKIVPISRFYPYVLIHINPTCVI